MELLTEIRNAIDFLKAKPEEIDVTETIRLLSLAHEVGRDGLERSQNADFYLQLKPKLEQLEVKVPELKALNAELGGALEKALGELEAFAEVLAVMRRETLGKLSLIKGYEKDFRNTLEKDIDGGDIAGVLKARSQVISDFNREWNRPEGSDALASDLPSMVDHKLYQTGA